MQHWMLPMLLSMYGRLRQADKVWALYLELRRRRPELAARARAGEAGHMAAAAATSQQQRQQQRRLRRQGRGAAPVAAPDAASTGGDGAAMEGAEGQQRRWQARLEARQAEVAAEAEHLATELRLDALPLDLYAYSAVITALSRVSQG